MQKSVSPLAAVLVIFAMVAAVAFLWMRFTEAPESKPQPNVPDGRGRATRAQPAHDGERGSGLGRSAPEQPESPAPSN
jgi:hypothetical protein